MSSAIRHIHYKPDLEELSVWFGPEGRRYKYFNVREFVFEAFRDAASRGQFFNHHIRGRFESRKIDPADQRRPRLRSAS